MAKKQNNNSTDRVGEVMFKKASGDAKKAQKLPKDDVMKPERAMNSKMLLIIITASVLLVAIIGLSIFFIVDAYNRDPRFDYLDSDLSKYIEFNKDYKDYEVDIAVAPPHVKNEDGTGVSDVEVAILNLLASNRELAGDAALDPNLVVGVGDAVYIWYRGYLKHPETGAPVIVSGMSNFANESYSPLGIGTGGFIPGFELGLVGTNPNDYARFEKIKTGTVDPAKHVAYISFTRTLAGSTASSDTIKQTAVRVDLADTETVKNVFGEGFLDAISGQEIGASLTIKDIKIGEKTYNYSATTVDFVTTCEKESTNGGKPVKVVECYFPYDYGTTGLSSANLRNETAYFEVYIDYVQDYTADEWNDEFLEKFLASEDSVIDREYLVENYDGETLTARYEKYIADQLQKAYEEERESLIEDAMWDYYLASSTATRYPGEKVDEILKEYKDDVYYQFEQTGGMLQNSDGEYETFTDVDSFARAYLGLGEKADWEDTLKTMSENLVKERLVLYYIMKEENLVPDAATLAVKITELKQEYLDEYVKQFLESDDKTREDFTDAEYDSYVAERAEELYSYYDDDYFTETAYYDIAVETLITWPTVNDLRDGAYPYTSVK